MRNTVKEVNSKAKRREGTGIERVGGGAQVVAYLLARPGVPG